MRIRRNPIAASVIPAVLLASPLTAQLPLSPPANTGQTVTPVFEGWYRNPDGSFSLSFGYFNRNFGEILEIPTGSDNFVSPGSADQGQPTHFEVRRNWGVFVVRVPADFGEGKVTWTLRIRGETNAIPGSLDPLWEIDALEGEAGSGNTPPVIRFDADGREGAGPGGVTIGPLAARVGTPLPLSLVARDDGRASGSVATNGREGVPVSLTWFKHQGPGPVSFADSTKQVGPDGRASTSATFSVPGMYILRVRANDASGVEGAGHAQCCWTNGFVKVNVTR